MTAINRGPRFKAARQRAASHIRAMESGPPEPASTIAGAAFQSANRSFAWLAVIAGLSAKTVDGASAFSYPLIFLPFISSAFVPTDSMPGPVRVFAENQPVTSIVNAIRDLFTQQPVGTDIWIALAWCVGILIVAYTFAMVAYRRRITG